MAQLEARYDKNATLICVLGALGLSVIAGLYMYFVIGVNPGDYMMVIHGLSLPRCGLRRGRSFRQCERRGLRP